MQEKKIQAIDLRLKGLSYKEISEETLVPKSTLSSWLRNVSLSPEAQIRLDKRVHQGTLDSLVVRNKLQTQEAQKRALLIQSSAKVEILPISKDDLRIIGTALYWAEGYKRPIVRNGKQVTSHAISFVNADSHMIRIFIRFLIEILEIPKGDIRATMRLYDHINHQEAYAYWITETNLPEECFRKSTYQVSVASKGIRGFNRLPFGTLQIGVYKTAKFHEIIGLIEGMKLQAQYATISTLSEGG